MTQDINEGRLRATTMRGDDDEDCRWLLAIVIV
jgi:hypothetical protein